MTYMEMRKSALVGWMLATNALAALAFTQHVLGNPIWLIALTLFSAGWSALGVSIVYSHRTPDPAPSASGTP